MIMKNKNYDIAIIGCGNIAGLLDNPNNKAIITHAHGVFKYKNTKLVACVEPNSNQAKKFQDIWGKLPIYKDIKTLLKNKKIDIAIISSPTNLHFKHIQELSSVEKILCEKPFVNSIDEFNLIQKELKEKILVNYIRRFDSSFQEVKKIIDNKELGEVVSFYGKFTKGLYHNGSHLLELLSWFFAGLKLIEVKNKEIKDNDIFGEFFIKTSLADGIIINSTKLNFSIFELELLFENGRIKIENSGYKISIEKAYLSENFKGYLNLKEDRVLDNSLQYYGFNSIKALFDINQYNQELINFSEQLLKMRDRLLIQNNWSSDE